MTLLLLLAVALLASILQCGRATSEPPNIIVLVLDDVDLTLGSIEVWLMIIDENHEERAQRT